MKYFAEPGLESPVEAFYASYLPDVQRGHSLEAMIKPQVVEAKWDAEALRRRMN